VTVDARSTRRDASVDVAYTIAEGQPTRIGRIVVRGLTRTREHVVRRELPLQAGDPLDPEALIEAQRRLSLLGIFERVDVEPLRPPTTPYADVTITVREGRPWYVAAGVGYSTYERFRGFVEGGHDNLFGTGRSLGVRLRASQRNHRGEVIYREPWVLGTRWRGEATVFHEFRDEIGYDLERTGLTLGIERELLTERIRGLRAKVGYTLALVDRFDIDESLIEADDTPGREIVASITPELTLDRRDRAFDPRRGSFHRVSVELGGVFVGGEANFVKSRAETVWLFDRWVPSTVFAFGARFGLAAPLLDSESLPIEERFFAGGATTVRGYRERRVGPLDADDNPTGGNALVVLNAEWRFPLWRWLGGAVFYDVGTVTPEVEDLAFDALKSGAGAGLRVATPVGPLRLDVGYPLDDVAGEKRTLRVYISVGYPF
jgi:outer membrane protein insertion porin family